MSVFHWALFSLCFVIALLHSASAFLKRRIAKILSYVNISLHIPLVFLFLFSDVSLQTVALCFMSDLLLYLIVNLLALRIECRREGTDDI